MRLEDGVCARCPYYVLEAPLRRMPGRVGSSEPVFREMGLGGSVVRDSLGKTSGS